MDKQQRLDGPPFTCICVQYAAHVSEKAEVHVEKGDMKRVAAMRRERGDLHEAYLCYPLLVARSWRRQCCRVAACSTRTACQRGLRP